MLGSKSGKYFWNCQQLHIEASYLFEFVLRTDRRTKNLLVLLSFFSRWNFQKFHAYVDVFFEMQMFHVDARALKTPNRTSRHTSFESLYNLDSKKKKRLHIISRSLRSTAQILPLVDLHKKSSKIKITNKKSNFRWIWSLFAKINGGYKSGSRSKGSKDNMKAFLLFRI